MKFLFYILILVTIWTQAHAEDPHHGHDNNYTDPGTQLVTSTDYVPTTNLDCSGDAISMANGAHQFNTATRKRSFSIAGSSYKSCQAVSFGGGFNIDQNIYISFAYTAGEGDGAITGAGLFLF